MSGVLGQESGLEALAGVIKDYWTIRKPLRDSLSLSYMIISKYWAPQTENA
jgi:hypothetical protein